MIERHLWPAIKAVFLLVVSVVVCLVVSLMINGSSLVESVIILKELL